jgi:membrane fusion protein (multidrug efflux system)
MSEKTPEKGTQFSTAKKDSPAANAPQKGNPKKHGWFRRNIPKVVIILVAVAILTVIARIPKRDRYAEPTEAAPVNVTVMTIEKEPRFAETFELPAIVEPNRIVTVAAEVEGRVERIPSAEGSRVKAGNLLVQLNADLIKPQYEMAEAQLKRDQIEFDRMKELVENDATSRSDLDNATTQLATSKAQLEQARARLERTRILAPISGVLNDTLVEEGEYVQVGTPVAEIVEIDTAKVVVDVPERDITFFEVGAEAEVFFSYQDRDKSMTGTITFISELADQRTRSTSVEITLRNEKGFMRSGQIVRVRLTRRVLEDAILIPLLAVIPTENGNAVYVVGSEEAQRREVKLGAIKKDRVHVTQGLEPGDKLIIAGHRLIAPGQKVNVAEK